MIGVWGEVPYLNWEDGRSQNLQRDSCPAGDSPVCITLLFHFIDSSSSGWYSFPAVQNFLSGRRNTETKEI